MPKTEVASTGLDPESAFSLLVKLDPDLIVALRVHIEGQTEKECEVGAMLIRGTVDHLLFAAKQLISLAKQKNKPTAKRQSGLPKVKPSPVDGQVDDEQPAEEPKPRAPRKPKADAPAEVEPERPAAPFTT